MARSNAKTHRKPRSAARTESFGKAYYDRYYGNSATRVSDLAEIRRLAAFVAAYLRYLDVPVRSILDVGCGVGHWRTAAHKQWPRARYHGVEHSEHLCQRLGWTHGSIADFDPQQSLGRATFDLVVCQGVMQYLHDHQAAKALDNLARWTDGALYLEALTDKDWRENCDRERTDGDVFLRSGSFYRRRLTRPFQDCGGGVFVSRRADVTLFELEGS
jgi:SAM-dependent methyltransferase